MDPQRRRLTVNHDAGPASSSGGGADCLAKLINEKFGKEVSCLHSVTDQSLKKTRSFAEKEKACLVNGEVEYPSTAGIAGVDVTCRKGLKPESPNQDSFVVVRSPKWSLFGVFDGHGPNGHDVSHYAVKDLVRIFFEKEYIADPGKAFTAAFTECQQNIEAQMASMDSSSSGSTCTMAFHNIETDILTIAHCGDSRGVLYAGLPKETPKPTVLVETEDHKPNLPKEKERITKMGGRVVFDGYYNYRVFAAKGMYPGLNMSRALGDVTAHKEAGLTAEPEINIVNLKDHRPKPLVLFICSDGVWEFIKSEEAQLYVDMPGCKVEKLAKKSWDSWMEDSENEISDDITALSVAL